MARPQKAGLDYFPLDCGFFKNRKIKRLRRAFGEVGITTYLNLLCKIYENGYYLKFDNIEDLSSDITEEIVNNQLTKIANCVTRCIHYMADNGLLDKGCLEIGVITSRAIQEQYITSMEKCKRKGKIEEYNLMDSNFTIPKNEDSSEETSVSSEETPINTELMQQIKSNQTDDNNTHNSIYLTRTRGDWKTVLNTCVNVDNLSDLMETCFNDTVSVKQIETLLLDFLEKGKSVVISGKEYDFVTVAKKIESIDTNTFISILQNLYVKQDGVPTQEWKQKKINNLLHYALTAILK